MNHAYIAWYRRINPALLTIISCLAAFIIWKEYQILLKIGQKSGLIIKISG